MKFRGIRNFVAGGDVGSSLLRYVTVELSVALKDLFQGLTKLSLTENFDAFEVTETIPATTEIRIPNRLKTPSLKRIIVRQSGNARVTDGSTAWTKDFVYLENHSATAATVTVVFMR